MKLGLVPAQEPLKQNGPAVHSVLTAEAPAMTAARAASGREEPPQAETAVRGGPGRIQILNGVSIPTASEYTPHLGDVSRETGSAIPALDRHRTSQPFSRVRSVLMRHLVAMWGQP